MKLRHSAANQPTHRQVIYEFGNALMVQKRKDKIEIVGGSKDDHTDVKEFVSLFMHEAIVNFHE